MVFARGGHHVSLWDQDPAQVEKALAAHKRQAEKKA